MKILFLFILLAGCQQKEEVKYLVFNTDIDSVQDSIKKFERILEKLPAPNDPEKNLGYYIMIENTDTLLYVNQEKIGQFNDISLPQKLLQFGFPKEDSRTFVRVARMLFSNKIYFANRQCGFWEFVYQGSNDRGRYRGIVNDENRSYNYISCHREVADSVGSLKLVK
ncbi:hypothetical protein [Dyadobacter luteus]|nr:hypothetical protein [Dyadobacter luteus]